jgi:hypothetical protein
MRQQQQYIIFLKNIASDKAELTCGTRDLAHEIEITLQKNSTSKNQLLKKT